MPVAVAPAGPGGRRQDFYLDGDRGLGASWKDRARANVAAILVADDITKQERPATPKEQAQMIRFTGFGAGELANGIFRQPGEIDFRDGWDVLGSSLETAVAEANYASLARWTQYAHFTPEFIIRAIWAGVASADERLMQKAGLEGDIARLERLRAAHEDDQHAVRRQMRDAEREIEVSTRRIGEIGQDIARLQPTTGDAFTMVVLGMGHTERKQAGRALMKEILTLLQLQHKGEVHPATIRGFDLVFEGVRFGNGDGYDFETLLQRTGAEYEIELAITVTPLGAISRLEHALGGFEEEHRQYRRRLEEAERRLASYQTRTGGLFQFATELDAKRKQLREVEDDLAAKAVAEAEEPKAAPAA